MEKGGGHDFLCKVILLGEPDIGKTSLLTRYCDDTFSDQRQMTASFDNKIKKVNISNKTVALQVRISSVLPKSFPYLCSNPLFANNPITYLLHF